MTHSRRYSDIWSHFTVDYYEDRKASCNVCKREMSFKSTITNLHTHLKRHHPEIEIKTSIKNTKVHSVEVVDMENFDVFDKQDDDANTKRKTFSDDDLEFIDESKHKHKRGIFKKKHKPMKVNPNDTEKFINFMLQNSTTDPDKLSKLNNSLRTSSPRSKVSDCDAFAVRLSTCLQDLTSEQRFIAEKLISDVLFYGRFGKLSEKSHVTMLVEKEMLNTISQNKVSPNNTHVKIQEEQKSLNFKEENESSINCSRETIFINNVDDSRKE